MTQIMKFLTFLSSSSLTLWLGLGLMKSGTVSSTLSGALEGCPEKQFIADLLGLDRLPVTAAVAVAARARKRAK